MEIKKIKIVKLGRSFFELGKTVFLVLGMGPILAPKWGDREPCKGYQT